MSVDTKVYELAEHFLNKDAKPEIIWALAERIQESIEDWLAERAL